jgi:UDP-2-acetamido-2,6-beta-L-arabino-hexul-4-ose reductase
MTFKYDRLNIIPDSRGLVFEPLMADAFAHQQNAHVVISMPEVVRGNHYHKRGTETVVVMGPALVRVRENDRTEDIEIPEDQAYRFVFSPGVSHAIQNQSNQPNILVAFNTVEHDPEKPDTVRDVLI